LALLVFNVLDSADFSIHRRNPYDSVLAGCVCVIVGPVPRNTASLVGQIILTSILALVGFGFYRIRENYRDFYGLAEVVMGVVGLWVVLSNTQASRMTLTIALAGAVYFIVRGLDNFVKGEESSPCYFYKALHRCG
jgi:hypothetical protein